MTYGTLEDTPCIHSLEQLHHTLEQMAGMSARIETLFAGLTEAQLRHKSEPAAFSMLENLCHLRDIEIEGYAQRFRRTLGEDTPLLPDLDGGRMAVERRYNEHPVAPALAEFAAARRENVALLRGIAAADLERAAEMEKVGRVTLAQLVQMWREHDAGHRKELEELHTLVEKL